MPAVNPQPNAAKKVEIRRDLDLLEKKTVTLRDLFEVERYQDNIPIRLIQNPRIQASFEGEIEHAIKSSPPQSTKNGVNGSFFIVDQSGRKMAVFKPMSMETGMPRNPRMAPTENVQFRKTILPGQGAGNEVLAYALDRYGFGGRYEIPETILIRIEHRAISPYLELGSAQRFILNTKPLMDMSKDEINKISPREWEKLNFRLLSGSTDAHFGNILFCQKTGKLYLIDSGDDFVGAAGQSQYYNPWTSCQAACRLMTENEYRFLSNIDINQAMKAFEWCAKNNEFASATFKMSPDKYLTQLLRLYLAKVVGEKQLTQREWFDMMSPQRTPYGHIRPSIIERVYQAWISPHERTSSDWRKIAERVNWGKVVEDFRFAGRSYLERRIVL